MANKKTPLWTNLQHSFQLIGWKYALIILSEIILTLTILLFILSMMQGYEKSFLTKVIGSLPYIELRLEKPLTEDTITRSIATLEQEFQPTRITPGLAYWGTADMYQRRWNDNDVALKVNPQFPEIILKGLQYSPSVEQFLLKSLAPVFVQDDETKQKEDNLKSLESVFPEKTAEGQTLEDTLFQSKKLLGPQSLYKDFRFHSNDGWIRMNLSPNQVLENLDAKGLQPDLEYRISSAIDSPVSAEEIQLIGSYKTLQYILHGSTTIENQYNYVEMTLQNPMEVLNETTTAALEQALTPLTSDEYTILLWSDTLKTELAIISSFYVLLYSVMGAIGLCIGLLISSLLGITVRRKRRQIAVMMAFGAPKTYITRLFWIYSVCLSILGSVMGLMGAHLLNYLLEYFKGKSVDSDTTHALVAYIHERLQDVPIAESVSVTQFTIFTIVLVFIAFVATYFPAKAASEVNPIQGLKED